MIWFAIMDNDVVEGHGSTVEEAFPGRQPTYYWRWGTREEIEASDRSEKGCEHSVEGGANGQL